MSFIIAGIIAAAAAGLTGSLLAARAVSRHRRALRQTEAEPPALPPGPPDLFATLPARLGDVIQHEMVTRWPRSALVAHQNQLVSCALLLSCEHGQQLAVVVFPPPQRHILWLRATELNVPHSPPGRLEVDTTLLDRVAQFPATLNALGEDLLKVGKQATIAIYEGALGDAALVLAASERSLVYHGKKLEQTDYDVLGQVDPAHMYNDD